MRKVFLLTGFNNWGKSYLIEELFNGRKRFYHDKLYSYSGFKFCVQSQSNDDFGQKGYENIIEKRLNRLAKAKLDPSHIFTAFCPTKEPRNDSAAIISKLYSSDEVNIIAIEHKWCLHAKLKIKELQDYYSNLSNVSIHVLSEKNVQRKKKKLDDLLQPLL